LTSLPELPSGLQVLDCNHTQLTSLPELPSGLIQLYCSKIQLTSLPELPSGLIQLWCSYTQLTSLPNLSSGLQTLSCHHTYLTSLPELPSGLLSLHCSNTPLILQRKENESIADYNLRWRAWREEKESRKRIQTKHRLLKEEIVMEAWHPRKVERWVELGVELADL
jgi:Leucine-rich repeat (LRR) protein